MSFTLRISILVAGILLLASRIVLADDPKKIFEDQSKTVWRIDKPDVTKERIPIPGIVLRSFDEIIVKGTGCVQTGGFGLQTWKRYVDPIGPNSDRLYHGRIFIPGATGGLIRISAIQEKSLFIGRFPMHFDNSPLVLQLGYEDDDFERNGYENRCAFKILGKCVKYDDGTENQCKGLDNASIEITIKHHDSFDSFQITQPVLAPLDLWWNQVDENFLPLNPGWWEQIKSGTLPNSRLLCDDFHNEGDRLPMGKSTNCTTWDPDVDEAGPANQFCQLENFLSGTVHGHINWAPVTYVGKVYFLDYQRAPGDQDYDMELVRNDNRGLTTGNKFRYQNSGNTGIDLEFNGPEVMNVLTGSGLWWEKFRNAVASDASNPPGPNFGNWTKGQSLIDGRDAIITGLLGLDNEHHDNGAATELHPVYAMAVKLDNPTPETQRWAIFARNWGTEGGCSQLTYQHNLSLPGNKMKFFLPSALNGTLTVVDSQTMFKGYNASSDYKVQTFSDGLLLTISLPNPESKGIVFGEITFRSQ